MISALTIQMLLEIAENNPGAAVVLAEGIKHYHHNAKDPTTFLVNCKSLGLKGPGVWIAYKDYCNHDITEFTQRVAEQDETLVIGRY